jgi:hypothetical protein
VTRRPCVINDEHITRYGGSGFAIRAFLTLPVDRNEHLTSFPTVSSWNKMRGGYLEDQDVDGKTELKWIFKQWKLGGGGHGLD